MRNKSYCIIIGLCLCITSLYAQFGIKAGVNMANELSNSSVAYNTKNLMGYQFGIIYEAMPKKSGLGCEFGVLISQKGSSFSDTTNVSGAIKQGYNELDYIEIPFNIRYRLTLGFIGIYGTAGIYGGYVLEGKIVNESVSPNTIQNTTFPTLIDHVDYGYNLGAGLELFRKIQLGATWTQGLKNTAGAILGLANQTTATNRVFSINLVYLF